ncbi:hypothetical protein J4434_01705 [Candidatus Woesearchaeota archaeon]|nr:hypothetical protein [Candidatus Woesearchaeota archaeon]
MTEQIHSINDYGFLSIFDIEPQTARERVNALFNDSGIIHFQFYDCMERYEIPFDFNKKEWKDPLGRQIRRDTLEAYIDEIQKINGKSWFYIPVYGVSPNYTAVGLEDALFRFVPETQEFVQEWFCIDNDPQRALVSVVDPSSQRWKEHFTEQLKLTVSNLGFCGIHFDQYGSLGERFKFRYKPNYNPKNYPNNWLLENIKDRNCFEEIDKIKLIVEFLEYFKGQMPDVPFTFNAADGYGLEETMHLVEFPYLELWNDESISFYSSKLSSSKLHSPELHSSRQDLSRGDNSSSKLTPSGKFVIAAYTPCKGGLFDDAVFIRRKHLINHNGGTFLYKGDDSRFLTSCYFPSAKKIEHAAFE